MQTFRAELAARQSDPRGRRWIYVPYDQLSDRIGPLSDEAPNELGIVLIESAAKAAKRPYHQQKLALVLANQRHFALEQAARGVAVRYVVSRGDYAAALAPLVEEFGPLRVMRPAERELRADIGSLVKRGALEVIAHQGWLTTTEQFAASHPRGAPGRMDSFYRYVRKQTGVLMERGKPVGGKFSFDAHNREVWRGEPKAPAPLRFTADAITTEVCELIAARYGDHPGTLDPSALPATASDAALAWRWAREHCLAHFGPFQDAMSQSSSSLFHTRISALMHLHRILPRDAVDDVLAMDLPLTCKEGFVRQVLGWREFVHHVHEATDGFRVSPDGSRSEQSPNGATPSALGAREPLPPTFWGALTSGLACLDRVIADVWREGYGHHITRLMVLANIATLLDVSPRELTDWFWVAYTDAYDWVVEPNVLGMGTYGVGELMTTKPYVAGAAYIDKMSDYCADCAFDPKRDCPLRALYWAFLARHADQLAGNHRMSIPLASARKREPAQQQDDRAVFAGVQQTLRAGETLTPDRVALWTRKE